MSIHSRSFTVAGPAAWNWLPARIRNTNSHDTYCHQLNNLLFISAGYYQYGFVLRKESENTTLHLIPPTLLETLASSSTNILLSLTKLLLSPKLVIITFVNFAVYGHTLSRQLPVPLLPLSFTPNLITVILLYYKLPKSQLSRLQHIQNSLARTVMKAPKSCHITPILRSLH